MARYTVILLYPSYMTDNFGEDTYMTCVEAEDVVEAQVAAQEEVVNEARTGDYDNLHPADFSVIAVIAGEHSDIKE